MDSDSNLIDNKLKNLRDENTHLKKELSLLRAKYGSNTSSLSDKSYAKIFDALVDEVHVWKIIKDEKGNIVNWILADVNISALKAWRRSKAEVIGKYANEIFGEKALEEFLPIVKNIFETGEPRRWVKYFEKTDQYLSIDSIPFSEHFISTRRDISKLITVQKSLKQNKKKLNRIFNATSEAIIMYDVLSHEIYDCNEAAYRMYGYESKKDILSKKIKDLSAMVDGYGQKEIESHGIKAQENRRHLFEWIAKKKNGEHFWAEVSLKRMFINEDIYLAVVRDINDKKIAEKQLKDSEKYLKEIYNATSESIAIHDIETMEMTDCNDATLELYGYNSKKDILSLQLGEVSAADKGYDKHRLKEEFHKVLKNGNHTFEWLSKHKTGKYFWIEVNFKIVTLHGKKRLLAVARDINFRKQAEEALKESEVKFKSLAENTADALIVFNSDHTIKYISPAYTKLFGYTEKDKIGITDKDIEGFMHPEDRENILEGLFQAIANKDETHTYQFRLKHKKGHYVWVRNHAKFMYDDKGNYAKAYVVSSDIDEQKKVEEQLKLSNATKDKFFSILGHDLKGPLNNILGITDLLSEDFDSFNNEEKKEIFNNLNSSTKNSLLLLENLLDWYRTERTKIHFQPVYLNINENIKEQIDLFDPIAKNKNIVLSYHDNIKANVFADKNMLNSILRNLISNALKYTNSGGNVKIETKLLKDFIKVNVIDDGIGMTADEKSKLFSNTLKTSQTGTAQEKGTGLGLLICNDFIEEHGGKLKIESKKGEGSTFSFIIPLHNK